MRSRRNTKQKVNKSLEVDAELRPFSLSNSIVSGRKTSSIKWLSNGHFSLLFYDFMVHDPTCDTSSSIDRLRSFML